jgi:hypothetical protein
MQKQEFIRRFRRGYPHKTTCHTQLEDVMPSFGGIQTNKNLFAIVVWPKTPLCFGKSKGSFRMSNQELGKAVGWRLSFAGKFQWKNLDKPNTL